MFKIDSNFNNAHSLDHVEVASEKLVANFGEGKDCSDGIPVTVWNGSFTASDGTVVRASVWIWGYLVDKSVWVNNIKYLNEFTTYLKYL